MQISLIGLPSSGKSSIINSLIGKRMAQSGITRTTKEVQLYKDLVSDDGVKFDIYDLPGIADIEELENDKYNKLAYETIQKCNMIFWISDINKAFITNHEMKEFIKIKDYISEIAIKKGIAVQLGVILSKINENLQKSEKGNLENIKQGEELEIDEDSTLYDVYENVIKNMSKFNVDIICFNAYGRSLHHKNSSNGLRKFVKKTQPLNVYTSFNLKKYSDIIPKISDEILMKYFVETVFKPFLEKKRLPFQLPNNLILWCDVSKCPVTECNDIKCRDCSVGICQFRCTAHHCQLGMSTMCSDFRVSNSCTNAAPCSINFKYGNTCGISLNINGVPGHISCYYHDVEKMAKMIEQVYNKLHDPLEKRKIMKLILYDNNDSDTFFFKENIFNVIYDETIWNMIAMHLRLNLGGFVTEHKKILKMLTSNQIYRLLQICVDCTNEQKLYLYTLDNCETIEIFKDKIFFKEPIYNLDFYLSGEYLKLKNKLTNSVLLKNDECGKLIFNNQFLKTIKDMRLKVYGEIENSIDVTMIPIAYIGYGLFWEPVEFAN